MKITNYMQIREVTLRHMLSENIPYIKPYIYCKSLLVSTAIWAVTTAAKW